MCHVPITAKPVSLVLATCGYFPRARQHATPRDVCERGFLEFATGTLVADGFGMTSANVRYIVEDVEQAIDFYTGHLGFQVELHPPGGFAILCRDNMRLLLNGPGAGGAGKPLASGETPHPGGWNRIQIPVDDLDEVCAGLARAGARFKSRMIEGKGGRQVLLEDPSGNLVELFQPDHSQS